jgi:SAM-dependent methyltransferase
MIDRDAVRANAKYLRSVRPVDPEEICEYVTDQPHPAVVRRVLREEAVDLCLFEREDGTFVPANEEPSPAVDWRSTEFPDRYADAFEDRLVDRHGLDWHVGESGDRLREAVRRLKADYYHENPVAYDEWAALGYGCYHLPDFYAAVGYVLSPLAARRLLPRVLRVLDVGAGVGGPALGLHDYLPEDAVVDYHAVEPSAAADVLESLLAETGRNFRPTVHRTTAEAFDPDGPYDLILFANVLSELDDPVAVVRRYLDVLAPAGSLVALAPADLNTATGLRRVERAVVDGTHAEADGDAGGAGGAGVQEDEGAESEDAGSEDAGGPTVFAPTLRLWPGESPTDRGWSFDVGADVTPPPFQSRLDEGGDGDGTFLHRSVQFAYAILRTDGQRRVDVRASPDRHAKMAETERHVTNRVDLLAVKLSHDLSGGDNAVYKVGDGSEAVEHYAVLTRESVLNGDLSVAPYGAVLSVENVLVLWNDDEGAYNLVVDAETVVDLVG